MPTMWQRDLDADRAKLDRLAASGSCRMRRSVRVTDLVAPQSSGFSNDTLLFDLEYTRGGRAEREPLVVRIEPTGFQVFPEYDLGAAVPHHAAPRRHRRSRCRRRAGSRPPTAASSAAPSTSWAR